MNPSIFLVNTQIALTIIFGSIIMWVGGISVAYGFLIMFSNITNPKKDVNVRIKRKDEL